MSEAPERVRIDKWLWAARFFKTRALASRACELGRIFSNGLQAKASREVRVGDKLTIRKDGAEYQVEVLAVSALRGPASVAQSLYFESEESRARRLREAEERRSAMPFDDQWESKPSKRDRRRMEQFRGRV